ncbi:helix-turn-helix transcriptional regulator [Rheinheimera sp.]|uniref:helix-turn-helix domain-containing protein n=1 Tax=Rheinheimera sp. TaxID=1869214 RepID=UPI00307E3265
MTGEALTKAQVCEKLFWHFRGKFKTQKDAGDHYGVSASFISAVVNGKKSPTQKMLSDLGLVKVVQYFPAPPDNQLQ